MKRLTVLVVLIIAFLPLKAQQELPNSYFDNMGVIRLETQELQATSDTLVNMYHRSDDVVWSRIVYRIIDMRYKQNYQLYTPLNPYDKHHSSLLKVILSAMADTLSVYKKDDNGGVVPYFNKDYRLKGADVLSFLYLQQHLQESDEAVRLDKIPLKYEGDSLVFRPEVFEGYAKNQLKYLIQEIIFFDKHYSRLYTKILAIAPLHCDKMNPSADPMSALYSQIMFWIPFDALRPYMARQYMLPHGDNDAKRVTFDEFFVKKLYSSYIAGVSNVYDKMILQLAATHEEAKKWQEKIEWEMLTVEQDLWED